MKKKETQYQFPPMSGDVQDRLRYWQMLFDDAREKRRPFVDDKLQMREDLYKGTTAEKSGTKCLRNMCFELIETQINNAIPQPKITPSDADKQDLAHDLESMLRNEMDRLDSETMNDRIERGVLVQGSHFYEVGWDDTVRHGKNVGAITVVDRPIQDVWLQPGVRDFKKIEYAFVFSRESMMKIYNLTGKLPPESPNYKGMVDMITCWYYDRDGYVCRLTWAENTDFVIFDDRDFESRRQRVCKQCGYATDEDVCPICGSTEFTEKSVREETLEDDVVKGDPSDPTKPRLLLAKKGDKVKYYALRRIPLVMRVNISRVDSPYGVSDVDILTETQLSSNNILTKIEQNILKAGSIITMPEKMNMKLTNETLKVVRLKDPKWADAIRVQNLQASIQQDDILADRVYQYGRASLGITDSYQGKRDPTAESGKAKEISAAQAAGRMESKRKMKDAAYADLYEMMFHFFLAYCDNNETFVIDDTDGSITNASISRYNFLDGDVGNLYYDDSFMFSVDTASVLYTSREAMWRETTNNFVGGTMGNPQDPRTQMLYWKIMKELNYPLAKLCLQDITERFGLMQQQVAKAVEMGKKAQSAAPTGENGEQSAASAKANDEAAKQAMYNELQSMIGG